MSEGKEENLELKSRKKLERGLGSGKWANKKYSKWKTEEDKQGNEGRDERSVKVGKGLAY